jgi:hypothetical protein
MSGWIRLDRRWHNTDGIKQNEPFCERAAWVWLISNAAWKDTVRHNHKGELVEVQRGQIHVSLTSLETVFRWSKKKVRGFLDRLETGHMVVAERAQSGTVLTICNYAKYQDVPDSEGHGQGTAKGTVGARSGHTQEQGITNKQETNTDYAFFGRTVKLNANDYRRWKDRYHRIEDFDATLGALDDWIHDEPEAQRKKWFQIISGALNKKHTAAVGNSKPDALRMPIA